MYVWGKHASMTMYDGKSLLVHLLAWPKTSSSCLSTSCFSLLIIWRSQLLAHQDSRNPMHISTRTVDPAGPMTQCTVHEMGWILKMKQNKITDPVTKNEELRKMGWFPSLMSGFFLPAYCHLTVKTNCTGGRKHKGISVKSHQISTEQNLPTKKQSVSCVSLGDSFLCLASWIKHASTQMSNCSKSRENKNLI